jgi:hypothetical protein
VVHVGRNVCLWQGMLLSLLLVVCMHASMVASLTNLLLPTLVLHKPIPSRIGQKPMPLHERARQLLLPFPRMARPPHKRDHLKAALVQETVRLLTPMFALGMVAFPLR